MRDFNSNSPVKNQGPTKGFEWKTKRRYSYDRSTTKQLITFINHLF